jgi:hypothetical protein
MNEAELTVRFAKFVMPLYIDTAKTYAQLSVGALALTIVFKEKVLGEVGRLRINVLLVASWLCFLIAIAASAYYQWVAVRLIQYYMNQSVGDDTLYFPLSVPWLWPGYAYGVMVAAFFVAAMLLVLTSLRQLLTGSKVV